MASLFEKYREEFKKQIGNQKGRYAFRGQEDEKWELESSARTRMRNKDKDFTKKDFVSYLETQFINPAKLNGWHHDREVNRALKDLEILARFQHYGAATCLLDFTRSFHVALWFACQEAVQEDKNGKVFIVNTGDIDNFGSIEMKQINDMELSELLYGEKAWYWDLENLTDRVARQNSVFILGENNLSKGKQYGAFKIDHGDKKPLIKEMEDLFDLRPENLFKDIFGLASINTRDDSLPPDDPDDSFRAGNKSHQSGDYDEAIKHYTKAINLKPDFVEAYTNRGAAYAENKEHDRAIKDFNRVIELDHNDVDAYYNRGVIYQRKEKHDFAIADYTKAIKLKPDFVKAYNNRGAAYAGKGEHDRAIEDFNRVIELDPDDASAYTNRGAAYSEKGEHDRTIEDFSKAIELDPNDAVAYYNRGVVYLEKEEYDRAIADYTKAIELKPDYAKAYNNRGAAYSEKREHDKAKADFAEAERLRRSPPSQ